MDAIRLIKLVSILSHFPFFASKQQVAVSARCTPTNHFGLQLAVSLWERDCAIYNICPWAQTNICLWVEHIKLCWHKM